MDAANLTTRIKNICQIFAKTGAVSGTQEDINLAGRSSELDRQKILKGIELRRDMEMRFIGNYASVAESGATTRKSAGLLAFITSNDSRGSGGSDGGYNSGTGIVAAATNAGSTRTFTEALVKSVRATAFSNGARPTQAYMGGTHKQQFSAFTGIADIRKEVRGNNQATIIAAADIYVDDFGEIVLIPHPYGLTRDCVFVDPNMLQVASLRGVQTRELAKTGDNTRFLMTAEACLVVRNERSAAVIADLT